MQQHPSSLLSYVVVVPFAGTVAGTHLSSPVQLISSLCMVEGFQNCMCSEMLFGFVFTSVCVTERALEVLNYQFSHRYPEC